MDYFETQELNKTIAEFIGWETQDGNYYENGRGNVRQISDLYYERSWNLLMPVVSKIRERYDPNKGIHNQLESNLFQDLCLNLPEVNIEKTHSDVVKIIQWYNDNK